MTTMLTYWCNECQADFGVFDIEVDIEGEIIMLHLCNKCVRAKIKPLPADLERALVEFEAELASLDQE